MAIYTLPHTKGGEMREFVNVAAKALDQMEQERPRVVVPVSNHRKLLVEQVVQGQLPDPQITAVMGYVRDVNLPEQHRVAVMIGWLTGYKSAPRS